MPPDNGTAMPEINGAQHCFRGHSPTPGAEARIALPRLRGGGPLQASAPPGPALLPVRASRSRRCPPCNAREARLKLTIPFVLRRSHDRTIGMATSGSRGWMTWDARFAATAIASGRRLRGVLCMTSTGSCLREAGSRASSGWFTRTTGAAARETVSWHKRPLPGAYFRFGDAPSGAVPKSEVDDPQEQSSHTLRNRSEKRPTRAGGRRHTTDDDAGTKRVHQHPPDRTLIVYGKAKSAVITGDPRPLTAHAHPCRWIAPRRSGVRVPLAPSDESPAHAGDSRLQTVRSSRSLADRTSNGSPVRVSSLPLFVLPGNRLV